MSENLKSFADYVYENDRNMGGLAKMLNQSKNIGLLAADNCQPDLMGSGLGFSKLKGHFLDTDQGQETSTEEEFYLIHTKKEQSADDLENVLVELGQKHNLDSIFIKREDCQFAELIGTNDQGELQLGHWKDISIFQIEKMEEYYSAMRGGRPFTFDSVLFLPNHFSRQGLEQREGVDMSDGERKWIPINSRHSDSKV